MFTAFTTEPVREPVKNPQKPRPKREQVSRACAWCRTHRIKCDANFPCKNCKAKGRKCSDKPTDEVRTFPLAMKEIDRLKQRVKDLEDQLKKQNSTFHDSGAAHDSFSEARTSVESTDDAYKRSNSTSPSLTSAIPGHHLDAHNEHGANKRYFNWDGVYSRTSHSYQQQCYGPASSFYFMDRMASYLDTTFQQSRSEDELQPLSASRAYASPISNLTNSFAKNLTLADSPPRDFLTENQEKSFLELFWSTYHCFYPVLDKDEFEAYHRSLWDTKDSHRKPSPLLDIILALCLQIGTSLKPPHKEALAYHENLDNSDTKIAGRWFYRRCQSLLVDEWEGPSLRTFQTYIFLVLWLSNASFQNMAHSCLAMGLRIGVILGLHLAPEEKLNFERQSLTEDERNFRKRLWWTLYALEMKMAMELGRPLAVNISQVTCGLPSEDQIPAAVDLSIFSDTVPPFTAFNTQYIKLMLATRSAYITFYEQAAKVINTYAAESLYSSDLGLEQCAKFLKSKMSFLHTWLSELPSALRMKRQDNGAPFSIDGSKWSTAEFKESMPTWLFRQRLCLEILYHNQAMNLYRPFINFSNTDKRTTSVTQENAELCVKHAAAITTINLQLITETTLLHGSHELFQAQWNATISLIGYIIAYPSGRIADSARKSINGAITIFDNFENCSSAESAANIAKNLLSKANLLATRTEGTLSVLMPTSIDLTLEDHNGLGFSYDPFQADESALPSDITSYMLGASEFSFAAFDDTFGGFDNVSGVGIDGVMGFDGFEFNGTSQFDELSHSRAEQ